MSTEFSQDRPNNECLAPSFAFFRYLDPQELAGIDKQIQKEVLPFLKQFQTLNIQTQEEAKKMASSLEPQEYFDRLRASWQRHNDLSYVIDKYLSNVYINERDFKSLSVADLGEMKDLLASAIEVEDEKRVFSAGVKLALERYWEEAQQKYDLSQEELLVLFTPWEGTFWAHYNYDHLQYIHTIRTGSVDIEKIKAKVLCYHGNEESVLEARLQEKFGQFFGLDISELEEELNRYRGFERHREEVANQGRNLIKDKPDLKPIQDIVSYDNYTEQIFGETLYGIPDLYFRRYVISVLVSSGVIDQRGGVLLYNKSELLDSIDKLILMQKKQQLPDEPKVFLQTRPTTCSVVCTMIAMNYFLGTPELSSVVEGKIRNELRLRRIDIVPVISLVAYMVEHGLNVSTYHEDPHKFWRFLAETDQDHYEQQEKAYERARRKGISIKTLPITPDMIKEHIENNELAVYGIQLDNGIKHAILLYKVEGDKYWAIDPLVGKVKYSSKQLMAMGDLDTSRWCVFVGAPKKVS